MNAGFTRRLPALASRVILVVAGMLPAAPGCVAEVVSAASGDGSYHAVSPTTRSRAEVLKSIAQWQAAALADGPEAPKAIWSAENGLLSEQEPDAGRSSRIKLNDLDLGSLRASRTTQWQFSATSISGRGNGFSGHLPATDAAADAVALQALQDIYDLAFLAQRAAAAQVPCEFGKLGQTKNAAAHDGSRSWSEARSPASGRTSAAQVLYSVSDVVGDRATGGGQAISFAVQSFASNPVNVEFDVQLTSNSGTTARYHLTEGISDPSAPVVLGPDAPLSREPFEPGQCIARVSIENVVVKPLEATKDSNHRATAAAAPHPPLPAAKRVPATAARVPTEPSPDAEVPRPPFGKKVPSILPLPTTPSLDDACPYPSAARARGESGVVVLLVQVSPDGGVANTAIEQSSGFESLDQATTACVTAHGRFAVKRIGSKGVSYWGRIKFSWGVGI